MRKLRSGLCLLGLLLLVPALFQAHRILPLDTRPLVAEKYAGWTGVLNLWIYESWPCGSGSIAPWLNRCVTGFEKAHPGVYVQPQFVDAGAISSMNDSGILLPDMLLFPPDLLPSPDGLLALSDLHRVRPALARCGAWNGTLYAVPVVLGGYLWAWNADLLDALPDSWRDTDAALAVLAPQAGRRWDAALLALCSGRYASDRSGAPQPSPGLVGEVELGLTGEQTPAPTASPEPRQSGTLSRRLSVGFRYDTDAWQHFINGEAAAMPVSQREVRRLQALSDQGKGPQWQLISGDNAFTDQLLCLSIVDRPDTTSRQALCRDFLAWLLSDECQSSLCRVSAFNVTDIPSGYGTSDPLLTMDAALHGPGLCAPKVFDAQWVTRAEEIVRKFTSDVEEAPVLWAHLKRILAENPNN